MGESEESRAKRRRLQRITAPICRGVIRYLVIMLDMSKSSGDKDLRPTRLGMAIKLAKVSIFFIIVNKLNGNPSPEVFRR